MDNNEIVEKLKKETERFQEKMDAVLKVIKIINPKGSSDSLASARWGNDLFQMANAYFKDSFHFSKKGDLVSAFEAINISWGYIDSGMRLGLFDVPVELKKWFTVG